MDPDDYFATDPVQEAIEEADEDDDTGSACDSSLPWSASEPESEVETDTDTDAVEDDPSHVGSEEETEDVDALRRRQFVGWKGMCEHVVFEDPDVVERQSSAYQLSFAARMKEAMDCDCMITWVGSPREGNADFVMAVAYALTHDDWMDVAAAYCRQMLECRGRNPVWAEPQEPLWQRSLSQTLRRPFMNLVWTNVAYYYWQQRDRASMRVLLEEGVITPNTVLDMLFFASQEEHKLPVMKATAAVFAQSHGGVMDEEKLTKAKAVLATGDAATSDDRLLCCPVRCAMMQELIYAVHFLPPLRFHDDDEVDAVTADTSAMFMNILQWAIKHVNCSFIVFLFRTLGQSFIVEFFHPYWGDVGFVLICDPARTERWVYDMFASSNADYNSWDCMSWGNLSFCELFAPDGVLACLVHELKLQEFLCMVFVDIGLDFSMDDDPGYYLYDTLGTGLSGRHACDWHKMLTYALHECLTEHMKRVVAATSDEERRAIVFDYDFSNWDRMAVIREVQWETHVEDVLARCDFKSEADGGHVDTWFDEWKKTVGAMSRANGGVPRALEQLFDPRWARNKLASRKRALEVLPV